MDVVIFVLGERRYALELAAVEEVLRLGYVTVVPLSPPTILGATHVRGQVLPVVDTARLLIGEASRPTIGDTCLRVRRGAHHLLLYVGKVDAVIRAGEEGRVERFSPDVAEGAGSVAPIAADDAIDPVDLSVTARRSRAELLDPDKLVRLLEQQVAREVSRLGPESGAAVDAPSIAPGGDR